MVGKRNPGIRRFSYPYNALRWSGFALQLQRLQRLSAVAAGQREMNPDVEPFQPRPESVATSRFTALLPCRTSKAPASVSTLPMNAKMLGAFRIVVSLVKLPFPQRPKPVE